MKVEIELSQKSLAMLKALYGHCIDLEKGFKPEDKLIIANAVESGLERWCENFKVQVPVVPVVPSDHKS